jgi:hypothetical protein
MGPQMRVFISILKKCVFLYRFQRNECLCIDFTETRQKYKCPKYECPKLIHNIEIGGWWWVGLINNSIFEMGVIIYRPVITCTEYEKEYIVMQ